MIDYAYDLCGTTFPIVREFDIAYGTTVKKGQHVKIDAGKIVPIGETTQTDPYIGLAAEDHDGATDGRQSGTRIRVYCSPTAVFKFKAAEGATLPKVGDKGITFNVDATELNLAGVGGTSIQVVDVDTKQNLVYYRVKSQFA